MADARGRRIAIIGAGFSGSLLAVHLLRRSTPDDRIYLVERSAGFGRGLAYATGNPHHLLNVRAGNMSALSDQPDHFLEWLRALPENERAEVSVSEDRLTFASRQLYGSYIQHILGREIWGAESAHRLYLVADEAVALHPSGEGFSLETGCGRCYDVDAVALAVGNFPPEGDTRGYIANPWSPAATADLEPDARMLLVGSGLTMVDMVVTLLEKGHRGPILAISRRGLLPRRHAAVTPHPRFLPAARGAPQRARLAESGARGDSPRGARKGATGGPSSIPCGPIRGISGATCRWRRSSASCAICARGGMCIATAWRPASPPGSSKPSGAGSSASAVPGLAG